MMAMDISGSFSKETSLETSHGKGHMALFSISINKHRDPKIGPVQNKERENNTMICFI